MMLSERKYYDFQPIVFYLQNYNRMIREKYFSPSKILFFFFIFFFLYFLYILSILR